MKQPVHTSGDHTFTHLIQCRSIILLSDIDLIEKSQGRASTLVVFHALLVDSGHKNSAKAHQMNLVDLLLPPMLDLSHSIARKDLQAAV